MPDRFTVYDVFAVLIPGVIWGVLLGVTLGFAYELDLASLMNSVGDGGVVLAALVFGYAIGELLQATGKFVTSMVRRRLTGGMPATPRSLLPADDPHAIDIWPQKFKDVALARLQARYDPESSGTTNVISYDYLTGMTLQAYKWVEGKDSLVSRHLAQQHQMRAFFVAFALLSLVALGSASHGAWFGGTTPVLALFLAAVLYGTLATLAWWRMIEKDRTFARHVLCRFLELTDEEKRMETRHPNRELVAGKLTIDASIHPDRLAAPERVVMDVDSTENTTNPTRTVHAAPPSVATW